MYAWWALAVTAHRYISQAASHLATVRSTRGPAKNVTVCSSLVSTQHAQHSKCANLHAPQCSTLHSRVVGLCPSCRGASSLCHAKGVPCAVVWCCEHGLRAVAAWCAAYGTSGTGLVPSRGAVCAMDQTTCLSPRTSSSTWWRSRFWRLWRRATLLPISGSLHRYRGILLKWDSQRFTPFFDEETLASELWLVSVLVAPAGRRQDGEGPLAVCFLFPVFAGPLLGDSRVVNPRTTFFIETHELCQAQDP